MKQYLRDKLAESSVMIGKIIQEHKNPALMCSFGKDSMVLLAILRSMKKNFPVIFFRGPFFHHKHDFAQKIMSRWGLSVYDWPPSGHAMANKNGKCEVIRHFQLGQQYIAISYGNLYEPESGPYLCGLKDLLSAPTGNFQIPWDLLFCGHKSSDRDQIGGDLTLKVDVHQAPGMPAIAYPLRNWTDEDVWTYIKAFDIPFQEERYDDATGKDLEDKTSNPDWIAACTRCVDKAGPNFVVCPKTNLEVTNIGSSLNHVEMNQIYYGK